VIGKTKIQKKPMKFLNETSKICNPSKNLQEGGEHQRMEGGKHWDASSVLRTLAAAKFDGDLTWKKKEDAVRKKEGGCDCLVSEANSTVWSRSRPVPAKKRGKVET